MSLCSLLVSCLPKLAKLLWLLVMLESRPPRDCIYRPLASADEVESIVLVRLTMPDSRPRMVARLSIARGVAGVAGDSWGGGVSGSGFARLFCKLKLRACCVLVGATALPGNAAEEAAFSYEALGSDGLRMASCEGCRESPGMLSRPGARFLMLRNADCRNSDDDLDDGESSSPGSDSASEKRLLVSPKDCCWPGLADVSPVPDISAEIA